MKIKKYNYEGQELYVGLVIEDKNGFKWEITGCGPKRVMFICHSIPDETYGFTSHWHFVLNVIQEGMYTRKLLS